MLISDTSQCIRNCLGNDRSTQKGIWGKELVPMTMEAELASRRSSSSLELKPHELRKVLIIPAEIGVQASMGRRMGSLFLLSI